MPESNQESKGMTFEEMAAQEEQGMRPEGNLDNAIDTKFTQAESKPMSEEVKAEAEDLVKKGQEAKASGDSEAIAEVNQQIMEHPELAKLVEAEQGDKPEKEEVEEKPKDEASASSETQSELKLEQVNQAFNEMQAKMTRLMALGQGQIQRGAMMESLFQEYSDNNEFQAVSDKMKKMQEDVSQAKTYDQAQAALDDFTKWDEAFRANKMGRVRSQINYLTGGSGDLPPEFGAQLNLYRQTETDVANMKMYLKAAAEQK